MKWFIIGLFIGIVSFIPGISGGTILYLSGEYDNFTLYLSNIKKYSSYLLFLLMGGLIGILSFAKVIEFSFSFYPNATKILFAFLVIFSLPKFIKDENIKFKFLPFIISFFFLYTLSFFTNSNVLTSIPNININFCIFFSLCGFLDGFITIIPGISGSMIMMILGPYYLYKTICANVLNNPVLFIPLFIYFIGDFLGIFLGAKFTSQIIKKNPNTIHSAILGFILASLIVIIPFSDFLNFESLIILLISFILTNFISLKD